ncbi:MAG: hypothetical protein ACYTBJ_09195, partial [Planctomycetota bacterium]
PRQIIFPAATAVVALVLMVAIFNPFKFGSLFVVNKSLQNELDRRFIPKQLGQQFQRKEIPLSEAATVSIEERGSRWLIIDQRKKYVVKMEKRRLNVYKSGSPVWEMPQVLHLRRRWIPNYEGAYKVNYANLFAVLHIVNLLTVLIWLTLPFLRRFFQQRAEHSGDGPEADAYELPTIDLALLAIGALTVYMAYRSRRFIPIAAFAACPLLAMFIDQMARAVGAARSFHDRRRLTVPTMQSGLKVFFVLVAVASVLVLGVGWTVKFKRIYLDAWPTDTEFTSVFMRMTNSDAKPFHACTFMRENKLKGKMFNYWTEGGFIAYGQDPDPNTGKTPLQLFMDGRAQAAYMRSAFDLWNEIMAGGPIAGQLAYAAKLRGLQLSDADYTKISRWIVKQFRERDVWVILMPAGELRNTFVKAIQRHPDWALVFCNDKQRLFVDITKPRGRALFEGIEIQQTLYPDEFSRNLILAHLLLARGKTPAQQKEGLDAAIKAFESNPSQVAIIKILSAAALPELRAEVAKFAERYFDRFTKNEKDLARMNGYHLRMLAALHCATYLRQIAAAKKDTQRLELLNAKIEEYDYMQRRIISGRRW